MQKCRLRNGQAAVAIASGGQAKERLGGMWGVRVGKEPRHGGDPLIRVAGKLAQGRVAHGILTGGRGTGQKAAGRRMGAEHLRTPEGANEGANEGSSAALCASCALRSKPSQASEHVHDQENKHSNVADCAGVVSSQATVLEVKFHAVVIQDMLKRLGGCGDDVCRVDLLGNGLQALPRCFARFSLLRSLSVTWNELSELPALLGSLLHLQSINASFNRLLHVAAELANLPRLEELVLGDNQLSRLPASFDQRLTSLRRLALQYNKLEHLPRHLHRISSLTALDIRGNPLMPTEAQQASPEAAAVFDALRIARNTRRAARPRSQARRGSDHEEVPGSSRMKLTEIGHPLLGNARADGDHHHAHGQSVAEAVCGAPTQGLPLKVEDCGVRSRLYDSADEDDGYEGEDSEVEDDSADGGGDDDDIKLVRSLLIRRRCWPMPMTLACLTAP